MNITGSPNEIRQVLGFQSIDHPEARVHGPVVKEQNEDRYLLNVVYPAMRLEPKGGKDGFRDFASAGVVEKAAWRFMQKGAKLGMWHQEGYDHCAEVVESYIYRNPDPWFIKDDAGAIIQEVWEGDWLMGTILQPPTWSLYKAGLIGGVSPQGEAARIYSTPARLAQLRS